MLIEIRKAIAEKLKTLNINIVANDIKSGFDKPAFFVQSNLISMESDENFNTNIVSINIHYFPESRTELECLKMCDKLQKLFVVTLKTENRILTINDKSYETYDNVLQFKFNMTFTTENEVETSGVGGELGIMEELHINY